MLPFKGVLCMYVKMCGQALALACMQLNATMYHQDFLT